MHDHIAILQPNHHCNNSSAFFKESDGGIGSLILSPALSTSGSMTVTPITPMTPLTTPRTPLQILLFGRGGLGGPYRRSSSSSTIASVPRNPRNNSLSVEQEEDDQYREKQLLALQLFANFLNTAETTLNDITEREDSGHQVLGPGIVRVCNDMANEIEIVAKELNKEHDYAAQHLQKIRNVEEDDNDAMEEKRNSELIEFTNETAAVFSTLTNSESTSSFQSHQEFIATLSTTRTLLMDLAAALRAVTQQEAQELGEVAIEVARIFVSSLGMVHSNMIQTTVTYDCQPLEVSREELLRDPMENSATGSITRQNRVSWSSPRGLGPVVEILGEEENKDEHVLYPTEHSPKKNMSPIRYTPQLSPIPSSPDKLFSIAHNINSKHSGERVRVIWPPLLPAVAEASKRCASNAIQHPIPAIAIGLTCGPAAIVTVAIAGPPLLVADWAIQSSYNALSERTPVVENVEKGAANALQVAKLAVLCSKLIVKQGVSVGERQIERRGGVGRLCQEVAGGAVDMAMHPVETTVKAWEGIFWLGAAVQNTGGFVKDIVTGGEFGGMDIH